MSVSSWKRNLINQLHYEPFTQILFFVSFRLFVHSFSSDLTHSSVTFFPFLTVSWVKSVLNKKNQFCFKWEER